MRRLDWRKRVKIFLVNCMGGKCNKCEYNLCLDALDFHHIDPANKEMTIALALRKKLLCLN